MNIEKAIERMESYKRMHTDDYFNFAISALEKQIPKEPEIIIDNQLNYADAILCPNCKHDLMGGVELDAEYDPPYCWECGQALKYRRRQEG